MLQCDKPFACWYPIAANTGLRFVVIINPAKIAMRSSAVIFFSRLQGFLIGIVLVEVGMLVNRKA